eukprot:m.107323 g.107323  ORF g.107323 m.107323 type:complete len:783 (-) comp13322_c0_seq2:167-2515(-)
MGDLYLDRFKQPDFDAVEVVNSICRQPSGTFDCEQLLHKLDESVEMLWHLHDSVNADVKRLEMAVRSSEETHATTFKYAGEEIDHGMEHLNMLSRGITSVAVKVVHVADQLETMTTKRDKSIETISLKNHLAAFDDFEQRLLPPLDKLEHRVDLEETELQQGIDNTRSLEDDVLSMEELQVAVHVTQKLQQMLQEMPPSEHRIARERLLFVSGELDSRCTFQFKSMYISGNIKRFKRAVALVASLSPQQYNHTIDQVFVRDLIIARELSRVSLDVFSAVSDLCVAKKSLIEAVFPNPTSVLLTLVRAVYATEMKRFANRQLEQDNGSLEALKQLYGRLAALTDKLNAELGLNLDDNAKDELTRLVIAEPLSSYQQTELQQLQEVYVSELEKFHLSINHTRQSMSDSPHTPRRHLRSKSVEPELPPLMALVCEDMVACMLAASSEAIRRCQVLLSHTDALAFTCLAFEELLQSLCQDHLIYAMWLALKQLNTRKQTFLSMTTSSQPTSEKTISEFFHLLHNVNKNIFLVQKHFVDVVQPVLQSSSTHYDSALDKKNLMQTTLEGYANEGLRVCIDSIFDHIKIMLKEQDKSTFRPQESDLGSFGVEFTAPCKNVTRFLTSQIQVMKMSLNGKNLSNALRQLGTFVVSALVDHIKQFTFTTFGGMLLSCDLSNYDECLRKLEDPFVNELLGLLKEIGQLFVVRPENLSKLISEGHLTVLDRAQIQAFLQCRSDYKSAKLASTALLAPDSVPATPQRPASVRAAKSSRSRIRNGGLPRPSSMSLA